MLAGISWTNHLIILARTKTTEEWLFYIRLSSQKHYGKRELDRQISSGLFERVMMGNQELPTSLKDRPGLANTFKSNYDLEFLNLPAQHNERTTWAGHPSRSARSRWDCGATGPAPA
jgi:predicted nuclease of restriction endonuclease-like (RecB) superfamily